MSSIASLHAAFFIISINSLLHFHLVASYFLFQRNAISRRAHKERAQPSSRKKIGLLEKHKDYVVRAKAFHKKEETLRKLKEKAAFRNSYEFYFQMIKTRTVDGVHKPESQANKYTQEDMVDMFRGRATHPSLKTRLKFERGWAKKIKPV
ncbi:probable U3 small nucleolar RNA-associated protein 11 [Gossypium hirsutum]|uniref:Probable U3 small nucleolar RNA-associated protein 11 n=1 Tax=Gossypium hirsutum TaxID=3635 RepID=A0ABM2ZC78_GOSHI|nr:probable U3 small nucleolar RNA-associated protein 11 [Gossypium hirsutum]